MSSYNVVLASVNGIGSDVTNLTYYFDWGILPDQPYYVDYSIVIGQSTTSANLGCLFCSALTTKNDFISYKSTYHQQSGYLGNIYVSNNNITVRHLKNSPTNSPDVYIAGRPTLNSFRVSIVRFVSDAQTNAIGSYVLTLKFIPVHNIQNE